MIKFLERLFSGSSCKTCEILQEQIKYERAQNKEMLETITGLLKPAPVIQQEINVPKQFPNAGMLWSRRRHELEKQDRERAKAQANSRVIGRPDIRTAKSTEPKSMTQLELESGVKEEGS